jgi:WD40 repeat protein/predicted Ser/Thr protein kinase
MTTLVVISVESLEPDDPVVVGTYRLLGVLGEGGMGKVFLGESPAGQRGAVKIVRSEHARDPEFRARFAREVAAARRVSGLYTASVIDADTDANPPWMVTTFVPGPSLDKHVRDEGPLPPAEVARLGVALAEGLAAIHECGLIHRDLKPTNIMLAEDRPRIIDFGIARFDGATTLTRKGVVIGTPAYMSPEQVETRQVRRESDVFALGGVLVYAATGHSPFDAESGWAMIHNIVSRPPSMEGIDGALRDVIGDCLHKEPERRPSLTALIARLTAMAGPVISPPSVPTPTLPVPPPRVPVASGALLMRIPGDERMPLSAVAFSPDGRILAGSAAAEGAWRVYLWDTGTGQPAAPDLNGKGDEAPLVAFSPDGRLLAVTTPQVAQLWRVGRWQQATLPVHDATAWRTTAFSPNGYLLATVTESDGTGGFTGTQVRLWSAATLHPLDRTFRLEARIDGAAVRFSPDGRFLLAGNADDMYLCDMTARSLGFRRIAGYNGLPGKAAFSADGRLLAAQDTARGDVSVLDTVSQRPVARLDCDRPMSMLDFSPADRVLATADGDEGRQAIHAWTVSGHPLSRRLEGFAGTASALRFSPKGQLLTALSEVRQGSQVVHLWRTDGSWPGTSRTVTGPATLMFSPNGRYLAVCSADQGARLWDTRSRTPSLSLGEPVAPGGPGRAFMRMMAFSPNSHLLATTDPSGTRLWRLP